MTENNNIPQGNVPGQTGMPAGQGAPVPPPTYHQQAAGQQQPYGQQMPPQQPYGQAQPQAQMNYKYRGPGFGSIKKEKWPAVVLAALLGPFGIHKYYMGYKTEGLITLLVTLIGSLFFGLGFAVMRIITIIEAVKYVSLTEEDFEQTYVHGFKGWF